MRDLDETVAKKYPPITPEITAMVKQGIMLKVVEIEGVKVWEPIPGRLIKDE